MTPIADLVEQMIARGVPADLIVAAIRTAELSGHSGGIPVDTAAEKRRAYDRERKAAKRNSTGNSTGIPPDTDSALLLSSITTEVKKEERKKERARGNQIPPDWQPNAGHLAAGHQLGFSASQVEEQAEDMRLWAQSNQHRAVARKSDWNLTFLSWLRRNKPKGAVNGHRNSTMAAFDELIARAESSEIEGDYPMRDITPRSS